jgi:murein DD-endopeptidase MepM/ murein hydrolase activator NlpD
MDLLRQRAWSFICSTFPERQLYIRSDGRVQFFTFSPLTQAVMVGVSLLFLGWVAFTSVNVIFKDRILTAKEHRFEQMQASYESRIADLQLSYDELNGVLVTAEDQFKTVADEFEAKQSALSELIERKQDLRASLSPAGPGSASVKSPAPRPVVPSLPAITSVVPQTSPSFGQPAGVGGAFEATAPDADADLAPPFAGGDRAQGFSLFRTEPAPTAPTPGEKSEASPSHPDHATFLKGAMQRLGSYFKRKVDLARGDHPILKIATAQEARIARLEMAEPTLLAAAKSSVDSDTMRLTRALSSTGVDPKTFVTRVGQKHSDGGPLLPLVGSYVRTDDDSYNAQVTEATASVNKLSDVVAALRAVPLVPPTTGDVSSGFGERVDPFNENLAFHSGVDFSGPKGTDVRATAAGIVVFTGPRGAYGNTVEVDHGYGIRTRYAHLSAIGVSVGAKIEKGAVIGKLGSTGRSTGPHVHYEVWYDDAVKDPSRFIKVGRDVLQE